jgi:hypothetical protein
MGRGGRAPRGKAVAAGAKTARPRGRRGTAVAREGRWARGAVERRGGRVMGKREREEKG